MWLLILFIVIPLIEIALFIQVGGAIGLLATLVIVIGTAVLGAALVRSQGAQAMANLRQSMNELTDPTEHLAHGAMILFSGALLLTPGFFTDAVGFALLVPAIRLAVYKALRARMDVQSFEMGQNPRPRGPQDQVIDGEFEEVDPEKRPTHGPSGWTKH
ncbi:FxsA family protein [Octadecabacter sp. SW4]|uniref:FxsA family protein n=1 Tax=Octadecabacter sp. SW4 TaxID=2602067 RepID=UPI0011C1D216|nr:FxsA family protein [Octadecabacter sp. SW4]QEE37103.1 FxsA family protein [Octadecabacter sp. SW4]|tara:strand:+ start:1068 stop:1544 length:477 start_codon:yes stop_codon:yes gene_type:complete